MQTNTNLGSEVREEQPASGSRTRGQRLKGFVRKQVDKVKHRHSSSAHSKKSLTVRRPVFSIDLDRVCVGLWPLPHRKMKTKDAARKEVQFHG